jgi:hypothetical protein
VREPGRTAGPSAALGMTKESPDRVDRKKKQVHYASLRSRQGQDRRDDNFV